MYVVCTTMFFMGNNRNITACFLQNIYVIWVENIDTRLDKGGGNHCVLKWGVMQTFPGNQDATLK